MQDINLLKPVIEQEQAISKSRTRSSLYITLAVILLLVITAVVFGAKFLLASQGKSYDEQISTLTKDTSEVQSTEDKINNFNAAVAQLKNLNTSKLLWSNIYDNIAKCTPEDIMLTQVTLVSTAAGSSSTANSSQSSSLTTANNKIKITGETKSRRSVALLQYKLQKIANFSAVDIVSSKETQTQTTSQTTEQPAESSTTKIDFEINISLKS